MKCTWKKTPKQINIVDFTESTGPTISLPANPLQIFMCFFTEELIKVIVDQSNTGTLRPGSRPIAPYTEKLRT